VEGSGAGEGMQGFCAREVEPMGVECEHVQIAALTDMIGVRVDIEYVDGR
jgi:ubiquitin thioesterase protein OTUB1